MPRAPTGSIYHSRGRWYAKVVLDKPRSFALPEGFDEPRADARKAILAEIALGLRRQPAIDTERAAKVLEILASASDADLPVVLRWAKGVVRGEKKAAAPAEVVTIGDLARDWTSGKLHERHPDRIVLKASAPSDVSRLKNHVLDVEIEPGTKVRDLPVAAFELDHGERILAQLPSHLQQGTRIHVARLVVRLLNLAVYPLRLIPASPLPHNWVPPAGPRKALAWIYPDEDLQLLACTKIPLGRRMLYGFLDREGCRIGEARRLEDTELDLRRGVLTLDKNKTNDPRAWALTPGVPEAIAIWLRLAGIEAGLVFPDASAFDPSYLARVFRRDLEAAGITRKELFERSSARIWVRLHELRATFVTLNAANGKSERWLQDRTGHKDSRMVAKYSRQARTAAELRLGELVRLDLAIPEIRAELEAEALRRAQESAGGAGPGRRRIVGGNVGGRRSRRPNPQQTSLFEGPIHGVPIHGSLASPVRVTPTCPSAQGDA